MVVFLSMELIFLFFISFAVAMFFKHDFEATDFFKFEDIIYFIALISAIVLVFLIAIQLFPCDNC